MPTLTWPYVDEIDYVGAPIDHEAIQEIKDNVDAVNAAVGQYGTSTFNGSTGRQITFGTAEADANYQPSAVATEATYGNLGDVYYTDIQATGFKVHCSGSFTGAMRWKVSR